MANPVAVTLSDALALTLFVSFGVWWVLAPSSVLRFYNWLHGGLRVQPRPNVVRLMGLLWVLLVITVFVVSASQR
jgi:hypothetical protein